MEVLSVEFEVAGLCPHPANLSRLFLLFKKKAKLKSTESVLIIIFLLSTMKKL